jgi:glycosyltransferase involved in cell wall biosynthesis
MKRKRLAILTTHPIQYHAAWFAALASHPEIDLQVFFCHQATAHEQAKAGFGVDFNWDIPLLDGYPYRFLNNVASHPSVNSFSGLDTPEVAELIARNHYDAVMVNGWHYKSAWQAMRACWRTQTPVMARGDSHLHNGRHVAKRVLKWPFYNWFISKLDACLAVGKWSREYYLHYGAKPERVFLAPHAVNDTYFGEQAPRLADQRGALRARWKLDATSAVYLLVGKLIDVKRPLDFVAAIGKAANAGARIAGLIVGDGPLRRECEDLVNRTEAPIRFAGFLNQSEIAAAYVAADALVLPSAAETWGLAVNEAMACGRPCFVSDQVGCGPDMIVHDETGALFRMGDREALATLLSEYAANPKKLMSMNQAARSKAQEYTVGAAVAGVLQALGSVNYTR